MDMDDSGNTGKHSDDANFFLLNSSLKLAPKSKGREFYLLIYSHDNTTFTAIWDKSGTGQEIIFNSNPW